MLTVTVTCWATDARCINLPPSDQEAQAAHAAGQCGSMGPGTGLKGGTGWVVSMFPGKHQFRSFGGTVTPSEIDMDIGRPYKITMTGIWLEWKVPGSTWGATSKYFLYP